MKDINENDTIDIETWLREQAAECRAAAEADEFYFDDAEIEALLAGLDGPEKTIEDLANEEYAEWFNDAAGKLEKY